MQLNQEAKQITYYEFDEMVKSNEFEVYEKSHVDYLLNQLGSVLEKSETTELTKEDKLGENLIKSELISLTPHRVLSSEFKSELKFTRPPQVEWDTDSKGNLMKGKEGTFLNTTLNRHLERVGKRYKNIEENK